MSLSDDTRPCGAAVVCAGGAGFTACPAAQRRGAPRFASRLLFCVFALLLFAPAGCDSNPADEFLDNYEALILKYERLSAPANLDEARAELMLEELNQFASRNRHLIPENFPLTQAQLLRYAQLRARLRAAMDKALH